MEYSQLVSQTIIPHDFHYSQQTFHIGIIFKTYILGHFITIKTTQYGEMYTLAKS